MRTLAILFIAVFLVQCTHRPLIESKEKIIGTAKGEINQSLKAPEGTLYLWSQENNMKGEYVFDITIGERGKVTNVFAKSRGEKATVQGQNKLKDRMLLFGFSFKMPKGRDYKFEYTFNFN